VASRRSLKAAGSGEIILLLPASAQRAILPDEQFCPHFLPAGGSMADRGLGDVQLAAALVKLNGAPRLKTARHPLSEGSAAVIYPIPRYMSLSILNGTNLVALNPR